MNIIVTNYSINSNGQKACMSQIIIEVGMKIKKIERTDLYVKYCDFSH